MSIAQTSNVVNTPGLWESLNTFLNNYGGLISLVSLLISLVIFFMTGRIRKNIKLILGYKNFSQQRKESGMHLLGILNSVEKDNVLDTKIIGDISRELSILEHYENYYDKKTSEHIRVLRELCDKQLCASVRDSIVKGLNNLIGDLKYEEPFIG